MPSKKSGAKRAAKTPQKPSAERVSDTRRGPRLLSGGNPQIPKGDGAAPVRAYIAAMPGWKRSVGRELDALVDAAAPGVRRAVRWNSPFYGVEGRGWFMCVHCFTKYVKVTFLNGSALRPQPPIESKSAAVRSVHLHEGDRFPSEQLAEWIAQASKLPGDPMF